MKSKRLTDLIRKSYNEPSPAERTQEDIFRGTFELSTGGAKLNPEQAEKVYNHFKSEEEPVMPLTVVAAMRAYVQVINPDDKSRIISDDIVEAMLKIDPTKQFL